MAPRAPIGASRWLTPRTRPYWSQFLTHYRKDTPDEKEAAQLDSKSGVQQKLGMFGFWPIAMKDWFLLNPTAADAPAIPEDMACSRAAARYWMCPISLKKFSPGDDLTNRLLAMGDEENNWKFAFLGNLNTEHENQLAIIRTIPLMKEIESKHGEKVPITNGMIIEALGRLRHKTIDMFASCNNAVTLSSAEPNKNALIQAGSHIVVCQNPELSIEGGGLPVRGLMVNTEKIPTLSPENTC